METELAVAIVGALAGVSVAIVTFLTRVLGRNGTSLRFAQQNAAQVAEFLRELDNRLARVEHQIDQAVIERREDQRELRAILRDRRRE